MVGTNVGTMYTGEEGRGYAEKFDFSKLAAIKGAQQAAKADERSKAFDAMKEAAPKEVWHYYTAETQKQYESWVKEGARIMTQKGINDPWKSTDEEAIAWQLKGAELKRTTENINQAKSLYDKAMDGISTRAKDYSTEYKSNVENFPKTFSYDQMAKGQFDFPQASFDDPGKLYERFFVTDVEKLKGLTPDGVVPTDGAIKNRVEVFFSAPENEAERFAAQQMYQDLSDDKKQKYQSMAERMGMDEEPWKALAFESYKNRFTSKPRNLMDDVMDMAKSAPKNVSEYSKEDAAGVTVGGSSERLSNKKYPQQAAKSYFIENGHLLDDESFMSQLGVSMDVPRAKRRADAEKAMQVLISGNITQKTSSTLSRQGRGFGDEEISGNYDQWRKDIGSMDPTVASQAAKFLFGNKGEAGQITDAGVKIEPNVLPPFKTNRWLVLRYENEKQAAQFQSKFFDEAVQGSSGLAPEQVTALKQAMEFYKQKAGPSVVYIPVQPEYEQILKRMHDQTARTNKSLYEYVGNRPGELDNLGNPSTSTTSQAPKKGALDDL